jgi:hypothetical protein
MEDECVELSSVDDLLIEVSSVNDCCEYDSILGTQGVEFIQKIIEVLSERESKKVICVGSDGLYLTCDSDSGYDITDDIASAFVLNNASTTKISTICNNAKNHLGFDCYAIDVKGEGLRLSYFKTIKPFVFNNILVANANTPIQLLNNVFILDNASGKQLKISNNSQLESEIMEISESEYQLLLSESVL